MYVLQMCTCIPGQILALEAQILALEDQILALKDQILALEDKILVLTRERHLPAPPRPPRLRTMI